MATDRSTDRSNRVLIIEDHALFAESLELSLAKEGYDVRRLELAERGGSLASLRSAAQRQHPRVVLLDLDLGRFGDGLGLVAPLAESGSNVVVVTASTDRGRWGACVRAGARKVIPKSRPLQVAISTVRRLTQGLPVMSTEELEELLEAWRLERSEFEDMNSRLVRLTTREKEVLSQLMGGLTVREIARCAVVSEATVRTQVKSILAKLEVSSQLAAVGLANRVGWRPTVPANGTGMPQMRHDPPPSAFLESSH